MGGDCFLIGLAPVLVHMAKGADGKYAFSPISVNLLVEVAKTLFALVTLLLYGTGRPGPPLYRSLTSFGRDAAHNRLLAIPAFLYAVNNYLKFAIQLYFKPTTAKMLSNLKIIVIALLMKNVLKRSFSVFQWEALFLLVAGITVNQLNSCSGDSSNGDVITPAAVAYTLGSITIPSLASVYNEFALKRHMETSVLLQNFFLYFYGACFNLLGLLVVASMGRLQSSSIFAGFSGVTVLLVVNNALQGILSSFFFKYADTILKKYSSTIATIFTGLMSALLFGHELTINFCIGVSIVFISMHIFFSMGKILDWQCLLFKLIIILLLVPEKVVVSWVFLQGGLRATRGGTNQERFKERRGVNRSLWSPLRWTILVYPECRALENFWQRLMDISGIPSSLDD